MIRKYSSLSVRPIYLIRAKEDDDWILENVVPATDSARNELQKETHVVAGKNAQVFDVSFKIYDTMKDLKLKKIHSGKGGAHCLLCTYLQTHWMDIDCIIAGFNITSSAKDSLEIWNNMLKDADGNYIPEKNDHATRQGITKRPITSSDQHSICILHSYINVTSWFVKVLARLNCEDLRWTEKQNPLGDHIRAGTTRVIKVIEENTGLRLSQVAGPLEKGGGSTTGGQGRRFFEEKTLASILLCVDQKYHQIVSSLHKNLSCIMRIISSTEPVDIYAFKLLTQQTNILIASNFPWVQINFTLHGVLHHSSELIERHDGKGLGALSEEALEANNKYVRRYLELFSRKTSPIDQLTDVMNRLLERSHPEIVSNKYDMRPKLFCTTCGSRKHSTKCHDKVINFGSYDLAVHDILIDTSEFQ